MAEGNGPATTALHRGAPQPESPELDPSPATRPQVRFVNLPPSETLRPRISPVARGLEGHLRNLENLQIYLKSPKSAWQLTWPEARLSLRHKTWSKGQGLGSPRSPLLRKLLATSGFPSPDPATSPHPPQSLAVPWRSCSIGIQKALGVSGEVR